jgi:hypothetical protein
MLAILAQDNGTRHPKIHAPTAYGKAASCLLSAPDSSDHFLKRLSQIVCSTEPTEPPLVRPIRLVYAVAAAGSWLGFAGPDGLNFYLRCCWRFLGG